MSYLLDKIITVPMVLIALMFHELAHGFVSTKLGDPTPRMSGRLSFNPLEHLDPVGTLLMIFTGFGWAKPVPVNPGYYKNPKKGMALTALAGPLANFALAAAALIIYGLVYVVYIKTGIFSESISSITYFIMMFCQLNLCFMVFNFIPIPPLDGSRVLGVFLSNRAYFKLQQYERYSFMLIIALSALGVFDRIIGTGVGVIFYNMMRLLEKAVMMVI